jgi:hypothetical protein
MRMATMRPLKLGLMACCPPAPRTGEGVVAGSRSASRSGHGASRLRATERDLAEWRDMIADEEMRRDHGGAPCAS